MRAMPRLKNRSIVYEGFWRIERASFETNGEAGAKTIEREIAHTHDAAAVLPFDPLRSRLLLVRQFRPAAFLKEGRKSLLEVCAGLLEPGEEPMQCALREAKEELGVDLADIEYVARIFASPGVSTETIVLYLAHYDSARRTGAGGGVAEEGEDIDVTETSLEAALAMIVSGEIVDAKTIILLQRLALERAGQPAIA